MLCLAIGVAGCSSGDAQKATGQPVALRSVVSGGGDIPDGLAGENTAESTQPTTSTTVPATPEPGAIVFTEDFTDGDSLARFDVGLYHRDDYLVNDEEWLGDHSIMGADDVCGPPSEKRVITRGARSSGFNNDWVYRCVPGADLTKAHMMTSIGDTSGYSIGAFSPNQVFEGIGEIRWDVNITELGTRQFTEVKVIPVETFDFQDLPCAVEWLPCETSTHGELGSVGVSFLNHELLINSGTAKSSEPFGNSGDPALDDVTIRRTQIFRDNGDGTLSYSIERQDGSFHTIISPGSFPSGPVRVVFADHNYTPEKDFDPISFTWHWDNIEIDLQELVS